MTPSFYYVFISLSCNNSQKSFIGNVWRVLLLGLWLIVFVISYRPERQGKASLNSGIHRIKSTIRKFVLKDKRISLKTLALKSKRSSAFKAVFTLGAQALVPGHGHKMVLCSDTGYPGASRLVSPVQCPSTTLYSGTGTVPEFWRGYLKKGCVHISAHQESFSGTVLGHQVWTQPNLNSAWVTDEMVVSWSVFDTRGVKDLRPMKT